jgi:hypothetical protein
MADIIEFDLVLDDGIDIDVGVDAGDAINAARAEAWAVGEKNGVPVTEGDPTWQNHAKYYAGLASAEADRAEEANRGIDEMVHKYIDFDGRTATEEENKQFMADAIDFFCKVAKKMKLKSVNRETITDRINEIVKDSQEKAEDYQKEAK